MFIYKLFVRFFFKVELWNIILSLYIKGVLQIYLCSLRTSAVRKSTKVFFLAAQRLHPTDS